MTKPLIVIAVAFAVLAGSGCCWPMHEWRGGRYEQSYGRPPEAPRPAPPPRAYPGSYRP